MTTASPPRPLTRDRILLALLTLALALGLWALARGTGWAETWAQIRALLALSLGNYLLRALRWHLLARRLGLPLALPRNALHFLGGFAMAVTPGRVGELVRLRWIGRETGWAFERAAPLVLADRASDLAAMAALLVLGMLFAAGGVAGAAPVAILGLAAAFVATRPSALTKIITLLYRLLGRAPRFFARARGAARLIARFNHGPTLLAALLTGLIGWAAEGYAFHLLLTQMGADIGAAKAITIFIFATLAGGLTGAPGGLGGAEAAMVALLSLEGIGLETALAATAVIRLTTLWFAILIGLALFPLAERSSLKAQI